jgi:hypothetical protein
MPALAQSTDDSLHHVLEVATTIQQLTPCVILLNYCCTAALTADAAMDVQLPVLLLAAE